MAITVRIPTALRRITQGQGEVQVEASNIAELIDALEREFPGIKERLVEENGEIRKFVNLFVNDEDIRFLQGKDTPLKDGDVVAIIPAIAGGFGG
ncbi:MAG: MoaD/ThiS family protein [Aquificae bacterium]|nr:MoaD/ThiS family protein [Aquificota bacterium]